MQKSVTKENAKVPFSLRTVACASLAQGKRERERDSIREMLKVMKVSHESESQSEHFVVTLLLIKGCDR